MISISIRVSKIYLSKFDVYWADAHKSKENETITKENSFYLLNDGDTYGPLSANFSLP